MAQSRSDKGLQLRCGNVSRVTQESQGSLRPRCGRMQEIIFLSFGKAMSNFASVSSRTADSSGDIRQSPILPDNSWTGEGKSQRLPLRLAVSDLQRGRTACAVSLQTITPAVARLLTERLRARAKCCLRPVLLYPQNLPSPDNPQCDAVILPVNIDSEERNSIQDYHSLPAAVVHLGVPEFPKVSPA